MSYAPLSEPQGQQPAYNPQAGYQQQQYAGQAFNAAGQPVAQQAYAVPVGYPAQQPQYVVAMPLQNIGQPGNMPRGAWSDNVFDCFNGMTICLLSTCLLPWRWAQTMERLQWFTFLSALAIYGLPWLVVYALNIVYDITQLWYFMIPATVCNVIGIFLGCSYRGKIRQQYGIPGSECEDCLLHTFCRCCAVAQEARHVDRDYAIPI